MDPELRAYLEAMEQRAAARDAETRQRVDALASDMKATRAVAEAALSVAVQARDGIEDARIEARALHEDTWKKIEGMKEGLSTHQRAESDRLDTTREEHVLPLEASAANHEGRIVPLEAARADHEKRIRIVEKR